MADFAEAFAAAGDLDDPAALLRAGSLGCALAVRAGQFELARERLAMLRAMAEKLGQPLFLWVASYTDTSFALLHGDTEEAERLATAALEVGTAGGQPDAFAFYGMQLMKTRDEQGRFGELASLIADAAEQNPSIPAYELLLAAAHLDAGERGGGAGVGGRGCGRFVLLARGQRVVRRNGQLREGCDRVAAPSPWPSR